MAGDGATGTPDTEAPEDNECPELDKCGGGIDGADVTTRLNAFTEMFTFGFLGRVCEPSYDAFFTQAIDVIDAACEGFTPVG